MKGIVLSLSENWGGRGSVLKCIPGVKLPKHNYTLMNCNTPNIFFHFSAKT